MQNSLKNKGVTLVEVMISLTIMLIVFLGLIQTSIVSIQSNTKNFLRDEAVAITSDELSRLRGANFDDMNGDAAIDASPLNFTLPVAQTTRNYKNIPPFTFGVAVNVIALDPNNKQMTVTTTWQWQGEGFQHQIVTTRQR